MKKRDVQIGGVYNAKVSGTMTKVRILDASPYGGWIGINQDTHRVIRIKTAARLHSQDWMMTRLA